MGREEEKKEKVWKKKGGGGGGGGERKKNEKKETPRPGIEPGSSAWQAEILTTILSRTSINACGK